MRSPLTVASPGSSRSRPSSASERAPGTRCASTRLQLPHEDLVLALPVVELRPRASEHDPVASDAARADLAGVEVLDDVRRDQRREHEDADQRVRVVADLVCTLLAAGEGDHVPLAQDLLAVVGAGVGSPRRTITHSSFAWWVWNGPCLFPGSTSYMLAPISSALVCAPTQASLNRQPSRSSVRSHSGSLSRLKTLTRRA